ncbi:MAG TPA: alpha-glucan family phosphorylase [Candidatus Paceibacterota bacterium]
MPKLIVFDLDNTLTESRMPIEEKTASLLRELLGQTKVAVISGAAFWQFKTELLKPLMGTDRELGNLYILTTSGAELWIYARGKWRRVYIDKLSERNKKCVRRALMSVLGIEEKELEPLLDDRDSGMTYSALGRDAPPDLKKPWDPDQKKRKVLVEKLSPLLSDLELKIGGTTSIDFTNNGIDKAYGVNKIVEYTKISKDSVVFIGDALFAGGNDNPVQNDDVPIIKTKDPENTREIMINLLRAPETIEANSISYEQKPVAFFCAEYALDDNSLRFAGGLGVLAADYLYEARDADLSVIALGLWYKNQSTEKYSLVTENGKPLVIEIPFERGAIICHVRARRFGKIWLLLIETDDDALSAPYSLDEYIWIKQDLVLGQGGAKLLKTLGIQPRVYHLNEGHSAFVAFELIAQTAGKRKDKNIKKAAREVEKYIVATKHTILKAGAKIYPLDFMNYFGSYCDSLGISAKKMFDLGTDSEVKVFSGTHFLLNVAKRKNAVSALHAKFEKNLHPKSKLIAITNGIYRDRWLAREWLGKTLSRDIWKIKSKLRGDLVEYTNKTTGSNLDPKTCTVVWARRFAAYKRPEVLINDLERLKKIAGGICPVQFIISGKVYLDEPTSQKTLERIILLASTTEWKNKIAYLPDYSISVAHKLTQGADIWLNTPRRGKEACGTSGMKAGLNGVLQMTVSDGWVGEVDWKNIGWILPEQDTAIAMYDLLEKEIAPMFYNKREEWEKRMQKTMSIIEEKFTTRRMLREYIKKLYKL